jgi:tetratricopeptide (TPR) repeat protein
VRTRLFALALASWQRQSGGIEERRVEEAIVAFEALRRLDPDYHPDRVAFHLAMLQTRAGHPRGAVIECRRALAAAIPPPARLPYDLTRRELSLARTFEPVPIATVHLNLAENLMLLGELSESLAHYRRALELGGSDLLTHLLALWGLALALDRSGEHREAIATARRAIEAAPPIGGGLSLDPAAHGPMAILHRPDVFFEPAYEVSAYDAIGREALARMSSDPQTRDDQLRRAIVAWRSDLAGGGNAGRYAEHARRAIDRLEAELATPRHRKSAPPPACRRGDPDASGIHRADVLAREHEERVPVEPEQVERLVHVLARVAAGHVEPEALFALLHPGVGDRHHQHTVLE